MKKLLFIGLLIFTMALSAQYGVYVRFFDTTTSADFADVSGISFEVELEPGSGDIQTGPSAGCFVNYVDVGAGFPNAFVQFDLANFANPYTPASNVKVTIWDGANVAGAGTATYNVAVDMDPSGGFLGWEEFFGVGGFPIMVQPDVPGGYIDGVSDGTADDEGMGEGTGLPNDIQIIFWENIGVYFTWTIEETLLPMMVTVTLDVVDLGYAPYSLAYWYNGAWHYVFPLVWAGNDVTFFVDAAKGSGRAPVAIPIAFSDGPNPEDILPVTLTNFLVSQTQGSQFATIAWTVQSETNMQGYNIYRSEGDFSSALNIKTIEALNSTELHTYSHIDEYEIVYNTTYNYWLEGVEVNGHSSILANGEVTIEEPTVEVPELSAVTKLVGNYPNPFNPTTAIKYQVKENETATLQIFNAKGQLIETATLGQTHATGSVYSFEGSKYGSGIYFYRLKTDNYSEVKKMMMLK